MPPTDDGSPPPPAAGPPGSSLVPLSHPGLDDLPTVITIAAPSPGDTGIALGEMLGGFRVTGTAGVGGMAAVLRATDTELGREVALKILPAAMARDVDAVARFKSEARSAARLDHENIARVFACGEERGRHFIAFEYVEGENLRALIDHRGPLPAAECVGLMLQLAAGLGHASSRGVVHRDIKPSNIVVTPDGRAKIVDMGLARNLDQPSDGGVTQSGVTLGTFDYISPEQALDPRRADVRSDIYSLGCAFYHALTGRPPVPEGTAARKLAAHANDPILDPRELNPLVPDDLAAVLARMMAKLTAARYQTPEALARDLQGVARKLDPANDSLVTVLADSRPGGALAVGLAAGVAGLAVAVGVLAGPRHAEREPLPFETARPRVPNPVPGDLPPPAPATVSPTTIVETSAQLAAALADPSPREIRLRAGRAYDLAPLQPLTVAPRPELTLAALPGGTPPEVRFRTLTIANCDTVTLRGLHVVNDSPVATVGGGRVVGIAVTGASRVQVTECRFEAAPGSAGEATALAVGRADGKPVALELSHGLFGPSRGVGLQLIGGIKADVSQTAFAPHSAAIALEPAPDEARTLPELALTSCSFLLDQGAAIEAGGPAAVRHEFCVFAAPQPDATDLMMGDPAERPATVVLSAQDGAKAARVTSQPDRRSLVYRADAAATPSKRVGVAAAALAGDAGLAEVAVSPWATPDPLPLLAGPQPWEAFRLAMGLKHARARYPVRVVGAVELPGAGSRIYDPWPPAAVEAAPARVRAVCPDPVAVPDLGPDQYRSLAEAITAAGPGEAVEIRHDGPLEIEPITRDAPSAALTVRAAPGRRPLLVPLPGGDGELVRLAAGALTLENLDFAVRARVGARPVAAVTALGGSLTLKSCSVTLLATDPDRLAAIALPDTLTDAGPTITLEGCLIRGSGTGLRAASTRPSRFTARDTLFGLDGPVINASPDAPTPARLRLERVTALLGGPLLKLDSAGHADAAAVELTLARCLIFPPGNAPVLSTRGPVAGQLTSLRWHADRQTAFANFPPFTAWATLTGPGPPERLDADGFAKLVGERPPELTLEPPRGLPVSMADLDPVRLSYPADTPPGIGADLGQVARPGK